MNDLMDIFSKLKPFLTNTKSLMGIAVITIAVYFIFTDLPVKLTKYATSASTNVQLTQSKQNLKLQEAKLKAIAKVLSEIQTKITQVDVGSSPQLASIGVAQKVVDLSDASENTYISLQPGESTTINVDTLVTLPITIPGVSTPVAVAPAAAGGASPPGGTAPATAPVTTVAPAAPPSSTGAAITLNTIQYKLNVKGTYNHLATFIHNLAQFPDLVLITGIVLTEPQRSGAPGKESDPDELAMELTFYVPWSQKTK